MAAHFLTGYNRKKAILLCIFPTCLLSLGIAFACGLSESNLPFNTQLDELRLLDPSNENLATIPNSQSYGFAPEFTMAKYINCRQSDGANCSAILKSLLESRPSDGMLWLEYARSMTLENGLSSEATEALLQSYKLAPHEGWMLAKRSGFALSVWPGLSKELQNKASDEIIAGIADYRYADFLAGYYVDRFLARKTIAGLLEIAPVEDQKRVLGLIHKKSKT